MRAGGRILSRERRKRHAAVAVHNCRKALRKLCPSKILTKERSVSMAVDVDKARRQHTSFGVDRFKRLRVLQLADRLDHSAAKANIRRERRASRTVDHPRPSDQRIQHFRSPLFRSLSFRRALCKAISPCNPTRHRVY